MTIFRIKKDDTLPYLKIQILDSDGNPYDLTNCTVEFHMSKTIGGTPKVNANATITDATDGYCEYRWQTGDTDTPGVYYAEFQVTTQNGGIFTVPVKNNFFVEVIEDLGD